MDFMISTYKWVFYIIAALLMLVGLDNLWNGYSASNNLTNTLLSNGSAQTATAYGIAYLSVALSGLVFGSFCFILAVMILVYVNLSVKFEKLVKR